MEEDKSCWECKYLGNLDGTNFVQDFACTWFPEHGKGKAKKMWPKKDPGKGCKFWERRSVTGDSED